MTALAAAMNLLALDLGTRTGWALSENGRIESGVQVFDVKRGESPGMRYVRFNHWLDEIARGRMFDLLIYEQTHQRGGAATEVAAGFATRVQEAAIRFACEHAAVHSSTLKKFATGKGNADKAMVSLAVVNRWAPHRNALSIDDNEADAIALLQYALAELVPAGHNTGGR